MSNTEVFTDLFGEEDGAARKRSLPLGKILLGGLAVLLLLVLACLGGVLYFLNDLGKTWDSGVHRLDSRDLNLQAPADEGPRNILLVTTDLGEDRVTGTVGEDLGFESVMVLHVPAYRQNLQVLTIPPQVLLDVPGHGQARLAEAGTAGGLPLLVETVTEFIGVPLNDLAVIDLAGAAPLTEALGGLTVDSQVGFESDGHRFTPGANQLDGPAALAFVKETAAFPDRDLQRFRNQQAFLSGLVHRVLSLDTLRHPGRVSAAVEGVAPFLAVTDHLDSRSLAGLGYQLRTVRPSDIAFFPAPVSGVGVSGEGTPHLEIDEKQLGVLRQAFAEDRVARYVRYAPPVTV